MRTRNSITAAMAVALMLALLPLGAWAQPNVAISIKAEKEVSVTVQGKQVKKMIAAKGVKPGETVVYTLNYVNSGTEVAKDVVISDPIPEGTTYITGSASKAGEVTFSIDKGKTFKQPTLLVYEMKGAGGKVEKKVASPEEYTDIRWTIASIPAGGKGSVSFKVKVK